MAPWGLDGGRGIFDTCREEAPSGAMVASSARSAEFMWILTIKIARWFAGDDDFCSVLHEVLAKSLLSQMSTLISPRGRLGVYDIFLVPS
jgi:hypothetical protein